MSVRVVEGSPARSGGGADGLPQRQRIASDGDGCQAPVNVGADVGAFAVVQASLNHVVSLLRKRRLLKKKPNVTPYVDRGAPRTTDGTRGIVTPWFAVHVAASHSQLDASTIREAESFGAIWIPGLRVFSDECCSPLPSAMESQREAAAVPPRPPSAAAEARFRFAELFAGIGGFRVGLEAVGGECVFASELSGCARAVYQLNVGRAAAGPQHAHTDLKLVGDITEVETSVIPDHDMLTAGFPCQSFCKVGHLTGLEDRRGVLFFEVVRILDAKKPAMFLLENVENLTTINEGRDFAAILEALSTSGYDCLTKVIDASVVLPQVRKRVYFVGFRRDTAAAARFRWPTFDGGAPVAALRSILETHPRDALATLRLTPTQALGVTTSTSFQRHPTWRLADLDGRARTLMSSYRHQYKLYSEFVTVDATQPPVPEMNLRFYSPRECARLQGFPDSFQIVPVGSPPNTAYRLLGNAVCPPIVTKIAESMLAAVSVGGVATP